MKYVSVMQLNKGCEDKYKKRHDNLWPDLSKLLTENGIHNYFIYLHPETLQLFASFDASETFEPDILAGHPIMQKWWDAMADIMETRAGSNAPVAQPLKEVFALNELPISDDVCLVFDIGKTNVKLCAVRKANGKTVAVRKAGNTVLTTSLYPCADTDTIWQWFKTEAKQLGNLFNVTGISITTHGATIAVMNGDDLALPVYDYESDLVSDYEPEYEVIRPKFSESLSPKLPVGLNLGIQLFWLQKKYPIEFSQATSLLTYPQYWGFKLSGIAASEVTSLGCHTDLWNPSTNDFSTLVDQQEWRHLFPPIYASGKRLGLLKPELACELGLPENCEVFNGIHDSNASLVPYLLGKTGKKAVVSSGTWTVIAGIGSPVACLDETKDMLANVNVFGEPTPCIRFMGGREWDVLKGTEDAQLLDVHSVIKKSVFAVPTFSDQGGPFLASKGKFIGDIDSLTESEKTALASVYLALEIDYCLSLLEQDQNIIVEGSFANNKILMTVLATLRPNQKILYSNDSTGTTGGTAMLACGDFVCNWQQETLSVQADQDLIKALKQYRRQWISLLEA